MKKKILLPMMTLALVFGLAACGEKPESQPSSSAQPSSSIPAKPTIVVKAAGDKKTLVMEETVQLSATADNAAVEVTWASSNVNVATVDATGKVTAVAPGTVSISATKDGYNRGSISITVTRPAPLATLHFEDADHYAADGWWGSDENGATPLYDRTDGNASDQKCIAHFGAGDKETLTFTSSAAINAEYVITMAASNGIDDMSKVMTIKLNGTALTLAGGIDGGSSSDFQEYSLGTLAVATSNTLEIEFLAAAEGESITYPYLDNLVFYSKQQATIVATPAAAKEAIEVAEATMMAPLGEETQIVVSKPTSLDGVSFVSDKPEVASVSADGKVTGVKLGSANIIVKKDGMLSARVVVTVDKAGEPGEIRVQAEDVEELPDGFSRFTDRTTGIQNGHYGGAYITGYNVSSACTLTYKFNSPKAQTVKLIIAGASHYQMSEDFVFGVDCTLKLNGNTITPNADAKIESNPVMGAPTVEVLIGDVNLIQGENTFVIDFAERAPALDAFRFIPYAS